MQETGRPTLYKQEYCEKLIEHMAKGYSFLSFAGEIGVCFDTLYEWEKVHKPFSEAKKKGRAKGLQAYERTIWHATHGRIANFNATAAVWFGKNVYNWKDRDAEDLKENHIHINISEKDEQL